MFRQYRTLVTSLFIAMLGMTSTIQAAPGVLQHGPYDLTSGGTPSPKNYEHNIYILEDNGYPASRNINSIGFLASKLYGSYQNSLTDSSANFTTIAEKHCTQLNKLAYDPSKNYDPWPGCNEIGASSYSDTIGDSHYCPNHRDSDFTDMFGPYNLEWGTSVGFYNTWVDSDFDNEYDPGECSSQTPYSVLSPEQKHNFRTWLVFYSYAAGVLKPYLGELVSRMNSKNVKFTLNDVVLAPMWRMADYDRSRELLSPPSWGELKPLSDEYSNAHSTENDTIIYSGSPHHGHEDIPRVYANSFDRNSYDYRKVVKHASDAVWNYKVATTSSYSGSTYFKDYRPGEIMIRPPNQGGSCQVNHMMLLSPGYYLNTDEVIDTEDLTGNSSIEGMLSSYRDSNSSKSFDVTKCTGWGTNRRCTTTTKAAQTHTLADLALNNFLDGTSDQEEKAKKWDKGKIPASKMSDSNYEFYNDLKDRIIGFERELPFMTFHALVAGDQSMTGNFGAKAWPDNKNSSFNWPALEEGTYNPSGGMYGHFNGTADDIKHATWNGNGLWASADQVTPNEWVDQFDKVIDSLSPDYTAQASGSTSNTPSNSGTVLNSLAKSENPMRFITEYVASDWSGDIKAFALDGSDYIWSASEQINTTGAVRELITWNEDSGVAQAITSSSFSEGDANEDLNFLQSQLSLSNSLYSDSSFFREEAIKSIRRDPGVIPDSGFKDYSNVPFGAFYNTEPVYVQGATSGWPNDIDSGYVGYLRAVKGRKPVLYAASNSGFLHAINAENGNELLGYLPAGVANSSVEKGLSNLISSSGSDRNNLDGKPVVADMKVAGEWKTLLLSGMGAGGHSLFSMDITNPSALSASNASNIVMWEKKIPNLGFLYGKPQAARMNDGSWVWVVGSGFQIPEEGDANASNSGINTVDGVARIFLINPVDGSVIHQFTTEVGSLTDGSCSTGCNGISSVTLRDLNGDSKPEYIYAGDLLGNIWAINISSEEKSNWGFENQISFHPDFPSLVVSRDNSTPEPLHKSLSSRPVTTKIMVADNTLVNNQDAYPNQMVVFGTGQLVATDDLNYSTQEFIQAVWHRHDDTPSEYSDGSFKRRTLEQGSIDGVSVRKISSSSSSQVIYEINEDTGKATSGSHDGWVVNLNYNKERVIHDPVQIPNFVIFSTFSLEESSGSSGGWSACDFTSEESSIKGNLLAFNILSGLPQQENVIDINQDGVIDDDDQGLIGFQLEGYPGAIEQRGNDSLIFGDTNSDVVKIEPAINFNARRSWANLR